MLPPVFEVLLVHLQQWNPLRQLSPDFLDRDQPFRLGIGERLQQDAVHDREDRGRRADGESESEKNGQRIRTVAPEAVKGITQVERQRTHTSWTDGQRSWLTAATRISTLQSDRGGML